MRTQKPGRVVSSQPCFSRTKRLCPLSVQNGHGGGTNPRSNPLLAGSSVASGRTPVSSQLSIAARTDKY